MVKNNTKLLIQIQYSEVKQCKKLVAVCLVFAS